MKVFHAICRLAVRFAVVLATVAVIWMALLASGLLPEGAHTLGAYVAGPCALVVALFLGVMGALLPMQ